MEDLPAIAEERLDIFSSSSSNTTVQLTVADSLA